MTSNYPRWPGDATTPFVHNLAQDLMELGWRITVLAPHTPGSKKREILGGVPVKRFQYLWPASLQTLCYDGGMLVNVRRRPQEFLKLPFFLGATAWRVRQELSRQRYDLVHSHCLIPQGFTCAVACLRRAVPHVATVHGSDVFSLNSPLFLPFKRFAIRHATAITVNSSASQKALFRLAQGRSPEVRLIPMGANLPSPTGPQQDAAAITARAFNEKGPRLFFAGRLIEEKGLQDLLEAMPLIVRELPAAHLVVAGEGPERPVFEALAERLGMKQRVNFVGWLDAEHLAAYYRAADMFIGPSRPNKQGGGEAQGLTFVEAMLAGTPVIATNVGGIGDAVIHEQTGLLVAPRSPQQIAAAVIRLWRDQNLAARLVDNAQELARKRFTRQASAEAFSQLFRQLLRR